jgi:hydrogenase-4 component B
VCYVVTVGIGVAALAQSAGATALASLALIAALLHAFNHGLFKALLFMGAGTVLRTQGTVNIEQLAVCGSAWVGRARSFSLDVAPWSRCRRSTDLPRNG